jgi:hypothetical protein
MGSLGVSSPDYQPGLAARLTPERQAALLARGFSTWPKSPSNYVREVVVDGEASAKRVVEEALDILFGEFGYRGSEELGLRVCTEWSSGEAGDGE